MSHFRDDVRVTDALRLTTGPGGEERRAGGAPPIKPLRVESNVLLTLRKEPGGEVHDKRESHNIFLNYGREWLAELIGLDLGLNPFRSDRIRYIALGIGGTKQLISADNLRVTWAGYPNHWGYTDPDDLTTGGFGHDGTPGSGEPTQTDTDPEVTGLEYPVQVTSADYFDALVVPATFPEAGTIRFTAVLGQSDVSFGAITSVPLSEIGLFTESRSSTQNQPPLPQDREVTPPLPANPPIGVRYMVAYNNFNTLSKTPTFVLQVDWEIRFA